MQCFGCWEPPRCASRSSLLHPSTQSPIRLQICTLSACAAPRSLSDCERIALRRRIVFLVHLCQNWHATERVQRGCSQESAKRRECSCTRVWRGMEAPLRSHVEAIPSLLLMWLPAGLNPCEGKQSLLCLTSWKSAGSHPLQRLQRSTVFWVVK